MSADRENVLNRYVVVDLETTGLSPQKDRIIEIGAVKVDEGNVVDTFCTFVDPQIPIPAQIQGLTGITQDMVEGQPDVKQAVNSFMDFCGQQDLMGHNLIFDYSFLKHQAAGQKMSFERNGIDTLKIARTLLPELESRSLTSLCEYFQIDRTQAHRAYHDALATHELYIRLLERAAEGQENLFSPKPLLYKVKKQGPITPSQKAYLNDLLKYHRIVLDTQIESLTKSEASRKIDTIISQYGRIMR